MIQYEMRRNDKEISDAATIESILISAEICRLGLVDDGEAYIVPLNFAYNNGSIYFHSAPAGRKIDLVKLNNKVTFELDLPPEIVSNDIACEWSAKYRSLMGRGRVLIIDEPGEKKWCLDLIMRKYGATGSLAYNSSVLSRMIVLKLEIDSITGKQSGTWD